MLLVSDVLPDSRFQAISGLWVFGLIPAYAWWAVSLLSCEYGWVVTAAFHQGRSAATSGNWAFILLLVGGIGGGMAVCAFILIPTLQSLYPSQAGNTGSEDPEAGQEGGGRTTLIMRPRRGNRDRYSVAYSHRKSARRLRNHAHAAARRAAQLSSTDGGQHGARGRARAQAMSAQNHDDDPSSALEDALDWASASLVAMLWIAMNIGVNIGFVLLEEDSTAIAVQAKRATTVMFGIVHEVFDHLLSPWVTWRIMSLIPGGHNSPTTVHTLVVAIELVTSVVAPLVAFVFASDGCLLQDIIPATIDATTVDIPRRYCNIFHQNLDGWQTGGCEVFANATVRIEYTAPWEFDGERCIASVIMLYTPAYLMVFAIRTLMLGPLWLLQYKYPWLVTPGLLGADDDDEDGAPMTGAARAHRNLMLHRIRVQIESNTFGLNSIAIGLCAGMASPVIALASLLCLTAKPVIVSVLEDIYEHGSDPASPATNTITLKTFKGTAARALGAPLKVRLLSEYDNVGPGGGLDYDHSCPEGDRSDSQIGLEDGGIYTSPSSVSHDEPVQAFPVPIRCTGLLLFFQSVYATVFLYAAGLTWGGPIAAMVTWSWFGILCSKDQWD